MRLLIKHSSQSLTSTSIIYYDTTQFIRINKPVLHSSKSLVYRKVAELKAPAKIHRAHSAHYGNVVLL